MIIHLESKLEAAEEIIDRLDMEILEARDKALDALSRYKFMMFGYWAGVWVHLNRIRGARESSPFKALVHLAREIKEAK